MNNETCMKKTIRSLVNNVVLRFLLVGGTSTLLDYIIYWPLSIVINYNIAKSLSMLCSCFYSYLLNKTFTFQDKSKKLSRTTARYIISQAVNIAMNTIINAVILNFSGSKSMGMVCATGGAMIINFLLQKNFVFKH